MTNREIFTILSTIENAIDNETVEVLREFGAKGIVGLDKKNAQRNAKPTKAQIENEPIKNAILEFVGETPLATASVIAMSLEISTQKASSLARQLVLEGKLISSDIKVPKKGTQKAYSIA